MYDNNIKVNISNNNIILLGLMKSINLLIQC